VRFRGARGRGNRVTHERRLAHPPTVGAAARPRARGRGRCRERRAGARGSLSGASRPREPSFRFFAAHGETALSREGCEHSGSCDDRCRQICRARTAELDGLSPLGRSAGSRSEEIPSIARREPRQRAGRPPRARGAGLGLLASRTARGSGTPRNGNRPVSAWKQHGRPSAVPVGRPAGQRPTRFRRRTAFGRHVTGDPCRRSSVDAPPGRRSSSATRPKSEQHDGRPGPPREPGWFDRLPLLDVAVDLVRPVQASRGPRAELGHSASWARRSRSTLHGRARKVFFFLSERRVGSPGGRSSIGWCRGGRRRPACGPRLHRQRRAPRRQLAADFTFGSTAAPTDA